MTVIKFINRENGVTLNEPTPGVKVLKWLYYSTTGKASLELLMKRKIVSWICGMYMDSPFSKRQIKKFITQYDIDMSEALEEDYATFKNFNNFFYRKLKPSKRPIGEQIVSPADGKILAFQNIAAIDEFFVKGSSFDLKRFLNNEELYQQYRGGSMIIVRLAPTDYHRFHFPCDGKISDTKLISGSYYSVSPIALKKKLEIFCQNKRTISILETPKHGKILISEIGATMVGSIFQTYTPNSTVSAGEEKGYFAFGGSTVVLLFKNPNIKMDDDLIRNTKNGMETSIKMGDTIASI